MALTVKIGVAGSEVDLTAKLVYPSLSIEQRADAFVSTCSLQLIDEDADVAASFTVKEKDSILVEDGATKYFAGVVANVDIHALAGGKEALLYTIECQDYNILVEEVVIDQVETYGAQQDSAIIDDLFDTYLPEVNSHTPGGAPAGYVQSLHVFAEIEFVDISLREALDRIATEVESVALEGYWYIDFDKYLHYFNVEDNAPAWTLSDTPDDVNSFGYFAEVRKSRQGPAIVNRILVVGAEMALFVQDYDSYDYYGKWFEAVVRDNTLITVDEVIDHGNSLLAKWAYPDETYEVTIRKEGLRAGMNVQFDNTLFGTKTRTNTLLNPSFEVNVTDGWYFYQTGAGGSRAQSAVRASVGTQSCKILASSGVAEIGQSPDIAVADGETITAQVRIYRPSDISALVYLYDSTNLATRTSLAPALTGTWEFLTISWTNDTGLSANLRVVVRNGEGDGSSEIWVDACMVEIDKGPYPIEYIDGTLPYCSWSGSAHNSTSSRPPVFMVKQLTITWPEETITYTLTLGGKVSSTALIRSRLEGDDVRASLGPVVSGQLPLGSKGWSHDLVFSATDYNTVAWTSGTITTAANETFSIDAGNTGEMAGGTIHYLHLDSDTSLTVLQDSATPAVGSNIILVAVAAPVTDVDTNKATFQVFGGEGQGVMITADNIVADTITANEIAANAIEAGHILAGAVTTAKIYANAVIASKLAMGMGDTTYSLAEGLLLLGPHCKVSSTGWETLRKQTVSRTGALHQVAGYWQGTRALVVESGSTNLVLNPSFEVNITDFWTTNVNWETSERSSTYSRVGDYSLRLYDSNFGGDEDYYSALLAVDPSTVYIVSVWLKKVICTGTGRLVINWYTAGDVYISQSTLTFDSGAHDWKRYELLATSPVTAAKCILFPMYRSGITAATEFEAYVDGVQMEESVAPTRATTYLDGSLGTGYTWGGTAHNSSSNRTTTAVNLANYVGLISSNVSLSFRCVVQMPFDADEAWGLAGANPIFRTRGADDNNYIYLCYNSTDDEFQVYINGAMRIANGSTQTFDAGDWIDLVVTLDFTADSYLLYVNGVLDGSDTTALADPTLTTWSLYAAGYAFAEYAVFDKVLSADEVAAMYALDKPTVDAGAMDAPGIYILDGKFKIASSSSGQRIEINPEEIAGYSSGDVKQFYLRASDGKAVAGAGAVTLDEDGVSIAAGVGDPNAIRWLDSGVEVGRASSFVGAGQHYLELYSLAPAAADIGAVDLHAEANDGTDSVLRVASKATGIAPEVWVALNNQYQLSIVEDKVRVRGGLYVGNVAGSPTDNDIYLDGDVRAAGGIVLGSTAINPDAGKIHFASASLWMRKDPADANSIEIFATDWLVFDISNGMDGLRPDVDETGYCGSNAIGWYAVCSKQFVDIGCLGSFEEGVEVVEGRAPTVSSFRALTEMPTQRVTPTEALKRVKVMSNGDRTVHGLPRLDYSTLPKAVYQPVYDEETGEFVKDTAELTALISVMIGALRELTDRVEGLE